MKYILVRAEGKGHNHPKNMANGDVAVIVSCSSLKEVGKVVIRAGNQLQCVGEVGCWLLPNGCTGVFVEPLKNGDLIKFE